MTNDERIRELALLAVSNPVGSTDPDYWKRALETIDPDDFADLCKDYSEDAWLSETNIAPDNVAAIRPDSRAGMNWYIQRQPGRMAADAAGTHLKVLGDLNLTLKDPKSDGKVVLEFRPAGRSGLRITLMPSSCADVDIFDASGGAPIKRLTESSPEAKVDLGTQEITDEFIECHLKPVPRETQE